MKFPFQHPHLTTILHVKVSLLLLDMLAEAEEHNRAKQYNLLEYFKSYLCVSPFFLGRLSKIAIQIFWLQCQMDSCNYGSFRQSIWLSKVESTKIKSIQKKDQTFVLLVKLTSMYKHINLDTYLDRNRSKFKFNIS